VNLAVNEHDFLKATERLGDELVLCELTGEDAGVRDELTIIREAQRDPVTERLVHIDFMRVDMSKPIDAHVALHPAGVAVGVREGAILEQVVRTLHVRCLPDKIPSRIDVDCTNLGLGQAIHVSDLELEEDTQVLSPATDVVFHVIVPRAVVAEAAEAEEKEVAEEAPEEDAEKTEQTGKGEESRPKRGRERD